MLSLLPIVELLKPKPEDFDPLWFRDIGGAAEYAQVLETKLPLPMAWVLRMVENAGMVGTAAFDDAISFDVVIGIENVRTKNAFDLDEQLLAYRQAVLKRLLGVEVAGGIRPIRFAGGMVIDYNSGELFWRDRYQLDGMVTNYLSDPVIQNPTFNLDKT